MKINASRYMYTIFPSRIFSNKRILFSSHNFQQSQLLTAQLSAGARRVESVVRAGYLRQNNYSSWNRWRLFVLRVFKRATIASSTSLSKKTPSASADTAYPSVQLRPHLHIRYLHTCRPDTLEKYGLDKSKSPPFNPALPPTRTER